MPLMYHENIWESQFFGFRSAVITGNDTNFELREMLSTLQQHNYRFAAWRFPFSDISSSNSANMNAGFHTDIKCCYVSKVDNVVNDQADEQITLFKGEANDTLISLAIQSGECSRFAIDKNFPPGFCGAMYTEWMRNTLKPDSGKEVLILKYENVICGFVSLQKINTKRAGIDLIAVDENFRRRDFGKKLINAALQWCDQNKYLELQVVTQQRNKAAIALYEFCEFIPETKEHVYHFWL